MIVKKITKSILGNSLLANGEMRSVYSTSNFDKVTSFRERKPQRQLKQYEKLFFSAPVININIEMILTINELRPKATYIIATKNGQSPMQIWNSTYNIIQCLNYIQGFKYFYKSFPALVQNITKVLTEKVNYTFTGIYKPNAIKRCVSMLSTIDCLHGEIFVELVCVYLIQALQQSIQIKRNLAQKIAPLLQRIQKIQAKIKVTQKQIKLSPKSKLQIISSLNDQIQSIHGQMKQHQFQHKSMRQQDFLCGLYYCLQKGYYSEVVLKQFFQNIMERDNYELPDFQKFVQGQEQFVLQKPLSNIQNKRATIYGRMFNNVVYRLKILNQLKKMKQEDFKFMDFLKENKSTPDNDTSDQTTQDSPFLSGKNAEESSTSDSTIEERIENVDVKLIEQSLISKKSYISLVSKYLQFLEKKDTLFYILSDQSTSDGLRIIQTQFFSYLNEPSNKSENLLTLSEVKSQYLNIFKQILDIQKNGTSYSQTPFVQTIFETVLRMYDYGDRKQIFSLLNLYERTLLTKKIFQIKTLAPFYVFEKYQYKSNFVASKLFEYINNKYRVGVGKQEWATKQQLILFGNDITKYLCLYFKLLEHDIPTLFSIYDMSVNSGSKSKNSNKNDNESNTNQNNINYEQVTQSKENQTVKTKNIKHQLEFQQAVDIFLNNYNKMISVVYLDRQNSGFIGKGLQLSYEFLRSKYFNGKNFDQSFTIDGKPPEQDIRKIISESNQAIKSYRNTVKNVYEKQFMTHTKSKQEYYQKLNLSFNPYVHPMISKRNAVLNPLDQISTILDIVETAIQLQTEKNVQFYEDTLVIFKSIFENKKLSKILSHYQTFPQILKRMIKISQIFKGSYKNESNKLFQSILNFTDFNLNNYLHNARINIAKQILNIEKSNHVDQKFQPYLHCLELNLKYEKNVRIWPQSFYAINKQNVLGNIRGDILYTALMENLELQKIIRDQLAKIKTVRPSEKIKNMKFQLNYLEYPYLANVAIKKNNQLIVILVRKLTPESQKPYNKVLNKYYDSCQTYYKNKGNKVLIAVNQNQIRTSLRQLIR